MEPNQRPLFQSEVTYTKAALKENQRAYVYYDRRQLVLGCVICFMMLILNLSPYVLDLLPYVCIYLAVFWLLRLLGNHTKLTYKRMLSQNEGMEVRQIYHFHTDHIYTEHLPGGNHNKFLYNQVVGLAQTKHYYVLLLEHRQFMLLDKATLTGGTEEDLVRFLCGVCPNMKPKKMRRNDFGKAISIATLVLFCLYILKVLAFTLLAILFL